MSKLFLIVVGLLYLPTWAIGQQVTFEQAMEQKSMTIISCKGNDESTHYLKPLLMVLKNSLNKPQSILLKAGTYFVSMPENYQDITVMADELMVFKALETKTIQITGVCTEPSNGAPNGKVTYTLGIAPKAEYIAFAQFVNLEKLYRTSEAQTGMWFLCGEGGANELIEKLHGCSGQDVYTKIFEKLAAIRNLKLRVVKTELKTDKAYEYRTQYFDNDKLIKEYLNSDVIIGEKNYQVSVNGNTYSKYSYTLTEKNPMPSCEISGGGFFSVSQMTMKISIGMFDKNGILVREIYANDKVTPGKYTVKYAYDCEKYPDESYYFKTMRNDKVAITVKLSKKG